MRLSSLFGGSRKPLAGVIAVIVSAIMIVLPFSQVCVADGQVLWDENGVEICTAENGQDSPEIISDGSGGAIITWVDRRSSVRPDIYIQKVNDLGIPQWTADGVAVCTHYHFQCSPRITTDGSGGTIITWQDQRAAGWYDIYAQKVSASGVPQWTTDGIAVCSASYSQHKPTIVSDGAGGAIITWFDGRSYDSDFDIYAQRINSEGVPQWTADGVVICSASDNPYINDHNPQIVSDGAGGAIITWYDYRSENDFDIYAQKITASGVPQWTTDGVAICTASNDQNLQEIAVDGSGGAIITWRDYRSGSNSDIYAQHVNSSGIPQWTADGVAVCTASNDQSNPEIITDDESGAIITWYDGRNGNYDVYAQRVNSLGSPQWTVNGVSVCDIANNPVVDTFDPSITRDGSSGAIISWRDFRSGSDHDIYAQHLDSDGAPQWTINGIVIASGSLDDTRVKLTSDGMGGAIATWRRFIEPQQTDIYAQRVGEAEPSIDTITPTSGPSGTIATIEGNSFGDTQADSYVSFGTEQAAVTSWSDTEIVCTVPYGISGVVDVTVTTSSGTSNSVPFTATVETTLNLDDPGQVQYSDSVSVSATLIDSSSNPLEGMDLTFAYEGEEKTETTNESGTANVNFLVDEEDGTYPVTCSFAGEEIYLPSEDSGDLEVVQESATFEYTGDHLKTNSESVTFSATLSEEADGSLGSIANAGNVVFSIYDPSEALVSEVSAPVMEVSSGVGQASITIDPLPGNVYTVTTSLADNGYYQAEAITSELAVYNPEGAFVTGGGYLGQGKGKCNFGFNVKYKGPSPLFPTGHLNYHDKTEDLKIKADTFAWLIIPIDEDIAYFTGLCTVNDEEGYSLSVVATDGSPDSFAIEVRDSEDQVVYEAGGEIDGGNIKIHR